jgi:hypothetical protein
MVSLRTGAVATELRCGGTEDHVQRDGNPGNVGFSRFRQISLERSMANPRQTVTAKTGLSRIQPLQFVTYALLIVAVIHTIFILILGINQPVLDSHPFRQTQTAVTTYWILKGGPWFAYETPVLGVPWTIPFEFPLYQLLTAGLSTLGVSLEISGRIINYSFFLGSLWPLWVLMEELKIGRVTYLATAILFLTCPLYLYWSRTFMIETCALFLALAWLALLVRYLERRHWGAAVGALAAGCFAVLAKATTFPAFALIGCVVAAISIGRGWFSGEPKGQLLPLVAIIGFVVGVPFAVGFAWVNYTDKIKMANEFGGMLTSACLAPWNFGTFWQRRSTALWSDTLRMRAIPDLLGTLHEAAFVALGATLTSSRTLVAAVVALLSFVVPFLVFTNLHIAHDYYQVSNGLFLLAAVGLGIGRVSDCGQRAVALFLLTAIAAGQLLFFYGHFAPQLSRDYGEDRMLRIALIAKTVTQPSQSLMVIGDDWGSTIPFYSERKALAVPNWIPVPLLQKVMTNPQTFLGNRPLGVIVVCPDNLAKYDGTPAVCSFEAGVPGEKAALLQGFVAKHKVLAEFGGCEVLEPSQ